MGIAHQLHAATGAGADMTTALSVQLSEHPLGAQQIELVDGAVPGVMVVNITRQSAMVAGGQPVTLQLRMNAADLYRTAVVMQLAATEMALQQEESHG